MPEWNEILPPEERELFSRAGFSREQEWGESQALLIVDATVPFTGGVSACDNGGQELPTCCGQAAREALPHIRRLLEAARKNNTAIVYTTGDPLAAPYLGKATKRKADFDRETPYYTKFLPEIAPGPGDLVLAKTRASAFFGTPLSTYLHLSRIDSIILAGGSTSGCVRATAVDGLSHGYRMFVAREACFDRSRFMHLVTLYDLHAKYADVVTVEQVIQALSCRSGRQETKYRRRKKHP